MNPKTSSVLLFLSVIIEIWFFYYFYWIGNKKEISSSSYGILAPHIGVAYVILVHSNDTMQGGKELMKAIYHEQDTFVFHVDSRMSDEEVENFMLAFPQNNIFSTQARYRSKWGSWNLIQATLDGINVALKFSPNYWEFVINLDGTSYPLTNSEDRNLLINKYPKNYIDFGYFSRSCVDGNDTTPVCHRTSARCLNMKCTNMSGVPPEAKPGLIYKGAQWFLIPRSFAEYVINGDGKNWNKLFATSWIPDESYFQTIAMNAPEFASMVQGKGHRSSNTLFTYWKGDECKGEYPCIFDETFIPLLANDTYQLFTRKLPLNEGPQVTPLREIVKQKVWPNAYNRIVSALNGTVFH